MTSDKATIRRRYSADFKAQVLSECDVPGASVAKVAMSHGINTNVVHGWRKLAREAGAVTPAAPTGPRKGCSTWPRRTQVCAGSCWRQHQGKGGAARVGTGARAGLHACAAIDSGGQHSAALILAFMRRSAERPEVMVFGRPVFDTSAPLLRVRGRKLSNAWTNLETLGAGIADSLYGFLVYPVGELLQVMRAQSWMRRFDFDTDTEAVVHLT